MEINRLIEINQKDRIGKYFFSKAITFALNEEFGKSFEFLKQGLDIITCDCIKGGWLKEYTQSNKKLFDDINIKYIPHCEYYFVKAYVMSYEKEKRYLSIASNAIYKYLFSFS